MRSDDAVLRVLDDLELEAEGLHLREREAEVGDLSAAEYAEVRLAARLQASLDRDLRVGLVDGNEMHGTLVRAGADWLLLEDGLGRGCLVPAAAVALLRGLSAGAVAPEAMALPARLTFRSVLRAFGAERQEAAFHLAGGRLVEGLVQRVGADFVEVRTDGLSVVVPLAALTQVRVTA